MLTVKFQDEEGTSYYGSIIMVSFIEGVARTTQLPPGGSPVVRDMSGGTVSVYSDSCLLDERVIAKKERSDENVGRDTAATD